MNYFLSSYFCCGIMVREVRVRVLPAPMKVIRTTIRNVSGVNMPIVSTGVRNWGYEGPGNRESLPDIPHLRVPNSGMRDIFQNALSR
jgi:hypothetical protein